MGLYIHINTHLYVCMRNINGSNEFGTQNGLNSMKSIVDKKNKQIIHSDYTRHRVRKKNAEQDIHT